MRKSSLTTRRQQQQRSGHHDRARHFRSLAAPRRDPRWPLLKRRPPLAPACAAGEGQAGAHIRVVVEPLDNCNVVL
mgnify:CR=1 FL=1